MHRAKHGAFCLALISNTRYPSAGKGHNRTCYSQVKFLLAFAERHQPGFSKHFCALFCSSTLNIKYHTAGKLFSQLGGIRTHDNKGASKNMTIIHLLALQRVRLCYRKRSSDIRFGTPRASRWFFIHSLEVTLQAYFTTQEKLFHGKKAAKSHNFTAFLIFFAFFYLILQSNCFCSLFFISSTNGSGSTTSTRGPNERIRITISISSA